MRQPSINTSTRAAGRGCTAGRPRPPYGLSSLPRARLKPSAGALLWLAAALLSVCGAALAQGGARVVPLPEQFTGLNDAQGGGLGEGAAFDGRQFFTTTSYAEGSELWVTDGSPAGTRLFADICPGQCGSSPTQFSVIGGRLYFSAQDALHGRELWALDAGAAAPRLFADINPGVEGSNPGGVRRVTVAIGGVVRMLDFVVARSVQRGSELWRVLPTEVRLERDFRAGREDGRPALPVNFGANRLLTTAIDSSGVRRPLQLVYSGVDTLSQVTPLTGFPADSATQSLSQEAPLKLGDRAFLQRAGLAGNPSQLWVLRDGGAAADIVQLHQAGAIRDLMAVGGLNRVFFTSNNLLHVSDGTSAGTVSLGAQSAQRLTALPTQLLLYARSGSAASNIELFRSNGTLAGTALVREIIPGDSGFGFFSPLIASRDGSRVYFGVNNQLWTSDGSSAGTLQLDTLADGAIDGLLAGSGRSVLVASDDGEPHFSAGVVNDLRRLAEVRSDVGNAFAFPLDLIGHRLLFNALVDGATVSALQSASATDLGNRINLLAQAAQERRGVLLGSRLLLQPFRERGRSFVTDGLAPVQEQAAHSSMGIVQGCGAVFDGGVITADDSFSELWRLDGSIAGSLPLLQLASGQFEPCSPRDSSDKITFSAFGDDFLVAGDPGTPNIGSELLRFVPPDSLSAVADINPGPADSRPSSLERLGAQLLFSADDGIHGRELWISDGSAQGTRLLFDIEPGAASSAPHGLRRVGNRVVFAARTQQHGFELWSSDGTAAGTALLRDLYPGAGSGIAFVDPTGGIRSPLLDSNATHALFAGSPDPQTLDAGCPVFITDGTPAGTRCAQNRDLPIPTRSFSPASVAGFTDSGAIVFIAHTQSFGEEVFALNNRSLVEINGSDVRPGARGSAPNTLLLRGNQAWFGADDGVRGLELYRLDLSNIDGLFADGFE
jgi:ELWxxDGT repeat protein